MPTVASLPSLSREYVRVPVTAEGEDTAALVALPVHFAFLADKAGKPADADWKAGSWDAESVARCLVGPGGSIELTAGTWWVWIRITGSIERPVRQAGQIKIT